MLPEWIFKYVGTGLLVIIGYIIISNTLWLLIGARVLQFLPGVNDKSARGTLKIVLLLILSLAGIIWWIVKLIPALLRLSKYTTITNEIAFSIQKGSKLYSKLDSKH